MTDKAIRMIIEGGPTSRRRAYTVDGVRHVACQECLPDPTWRNELEDCGRLVYLPVTTDPCEFCGWPA